LTRVATILHERLGNWARQLRPRLHDLPIRWFETRSLADLDRVLAGSVSPVVLIDLGSQTAAGLSSLPKIFDRAPDAWVLVLDPDAHIGVASVARELGATHVIPGFVPPPVVVALVRRWVELAQRRIEQAGWRPSLSPDLDADPWSWLDDYLGDASVDNHSVPNRNRLTPHRETALTPFASNLEQGSVPSVRP
jgi:hypothetical protein